MAIGKNDAIVATFTDKNEADRLANALNAVLVLSKQFNAYAEITEGKQYPPQGGKPVPCYIVYVGCK
jgi:hypothetical protein